MAMTFGQRLRELREAKGMSQRELARKASVSFAYVSRLETGIRPPPKEEVILALAKVLGASDGDRDELFGLAGRMPSDLAERIDSGMIGILRYLRHREDTPAREVATLRRRMAELKALGSEGIPLKELPGGQGDTFRTIIEDSPDGVVVLDSDLEVVYQNPAAGRILGYRPGDFIGKDTLGLIHPDDMFKAAHRLSKMIQTPGDASSHEQLRARHGDGTWRVIDVVAKNLLQNPAVKGIVVQLHEVTRRARDERAWAENAAASVMAKEYHLTRSEHTVLSLLTEGRSNSQIAEELVVSPSTVRFHVTSILHKLGVTSRTEAAAIAVRRHLVA